MDSAREIFEIEARPSGAAGASHLENEEHKAWDFKATISYCVVCCTVEGSILFTIGSFMQYPKMLPGSEELEWLEEAWVDWPFFIGGLFFTFGNYLCYFQVINKDHTHDNAASHPLRFFACPRRGHGGEAASLLNFVGALFFNIGTVGFLGWTPQQNTEERYDVWYVGTGVCGSLCFCVASFIAGEYNKWRNFRADAVVFMAWMNFLGSVGFLMGYAFAYHHYGSYANHPWVNVWMCTTPFFVGSMLFWGAAYTELYLWKEERFGLGFATSLQKTNEKAKESVSWTQMVLILVYFGNICVAWVRMSFKVADPQYHFAPSFFSGTEKILTYHCLLFLVSVLHKVPNEHPYDYLVYFMRFIAIWGIIGEITELCDLVERHSLDTEVVPL